MRKIDGAVIPAASMLAVFRKLRRVITGDRMILAIIFSPEPSACSGRRCH
jgi:hypothetical protein